jgi:predicted CXXCH cytochrome family protein
MRDSLATGVVHQPAKQGECLTCHDGHKTKDASGKIRLVKTCESCHDPGSSELRKAHREFVVATGTCGDCHDPHRSDKPGLIRFARHQPFAEGDCATCHKAPVPGLKPELVSAEAELCSSCHGGIEKPQAPLGLHAPVEMGECSACHNAHATGAAKLLKESTPGLCAGCHGDVVQAVATAEPDLVHAPVRSGECRSCHGGHTGSMPGLLVKAGPALCADCHQDVADRAKGPNAHKPAKDGQCKSCHEPHVGKAKGLLAAASVTESCARCHDSKGSAFATAHRGYDAGSGDCTLCHDPHGSGKKGLLLANSHAPYAENNCAACHSGKTGLVAEGIGLCVTCHDTHAQDATKPATHAPLQTKEACLACHSPHTAKTASLLRRDDVQKTCLSCHDRGLFDGKVQHPNVTECSTCHNPHGSAVKGILVDTQDNLCSTCHNPEEKHSHPYSGPSIDPRTGEALKCTSCHSPHSTELPQLLAYGKDRQLCVQCHTGGNMEVKKPRKAASTELPPAKPAAAKPAAPAPATPAPVPAKPEGTK